jgi:hypothetical protein
LRKEVLQITHAAGYEHPCQFQGTDISINLGDNMEIADLNTILSYDKEPSKFEGMNTFVNCPHIGKQVS